VRRSYKFRLRPTARQHVLLRQCLDANRELYNAALQERRDAYRWAVRTGNKMPVNFLSQSAQVKDIRALRPDVAAWSSKSFYLTLRQLDKAFVAFFRRVKAGETPGYPRFKSADRFNSFTVQYNDGGRWIDEASHVRIIGIGHIKATAHRAVEGRVKTITLKREGRHWYVVLSCDEVPAKPLTLTGAVIGLDVGIASFATTSDGDQIENPRHGRVGAERLVEAQAVLARKQRGSANRNQTRETVGRRRRKIARQRLDFHHKTARRLIADNDVVCVEALKIAPMTRSAKGTLEAPGTNVAAKSGLNRSILDAGWGQFLEILRAKAEEAGRTVIAVNPRHTSQTCNECGHVDAGNRVVQAEFRCLACGHSSHADVNAARNVLGAGLALLAADAA
jgi:putative transposase